MVSKQYQVFVTSDSGINRKRTEENLFVLPFQLSQTGYSGKKFREKPRPGIVYHLVQHIQLSPIFSRFFRALLNLPFIFSLSCTNRDVKNY